MRHRVSMQAGVGKSKVVFKKLTQPLIGYGKMTHRSDGSETDLFARAFILKKDKTLFAIVNLECCFITHHLKEAVINSFETKASGSGITMDNLMLCAQNTHSAPGGFAHYPFFNISTKGFRQDVSDSYVKACVEALSKALKDVSECRIYLNAGEFDAGIDVAFNRSINAYNQNPEVKEQDDEHTHLAVDRMMKQIKIMDKDSQKGLINWFGVKGTSISFENKKIHSDNKGYAASLLENDKAEGRDFVAGFFSEASADVSPNYHGRAKWWPRGRYEDEFKSAYFNGFHQFEKAKELFESEDDQIPISDSLDYEMTYVDLSSVTCNPLYTPDNNPHQTGMAAVGLAILDGSPVDNPGIDSVSSAIISSWVKYRNTIRKLPVFSSRKTREDFKKLTEAHGVKKILLELQNKRILGFKNLKRVPLPPALTEVGDEIRRQFEAGALKENTWLPVILPIQILVIGEIAILGYPGELTTVAGMRLRKTVLEKLQAKGVIDVIITQYANEYMGSTTTFEEYQEPTYERGYTVFGQYTLAAMQTVFAKLSEVILSAKEKRKINRKVQPPEFSAEELRKRTYAGSGTKAG